MTYLISLAKTNGVNKLIQTREETPSKGLETDKSLKIFAVPGSERNHRPIIAKENLYEAKVVTDKQTQTGKVPYVFDC